MDFRFVMIGRGGDLPGKEARDASFTTYCQQVGVFDMGTFYPFVSREKMNEVMNGAHVFVAPTIFEPHGIAAREAMMCGLPVVTTANGGVEDSINSDTGLIVPVKSPQEMAAAILKIKNRELEFVPQQIRDLAISQSGTANFLKTMKEFYNIRE
jgi:glycosyltransferase involved in cell wall biosynthesis